MSGTSVDPIELAERLVALLEDGSFTSTYKFAVLVAVLDLCHEKTGAEGGPPDTLWTREVAEKVIDLYWPQATAYLHAPSRGVLKQNSGGQAKIVSDIASFRESLRDDPLAPLSRARQLDPRGWGRLVHEVEWKLIEMPLPKLQRLGNLEDRFLYELSFGDTDGVRPTRSSVRAYQEGRHSDFDNRLRLRAGVGEALVRLHGLLRPMIVKKWAGKVADFNELEVAKLEQFLFGIDRVSLDPVRGPLAELHEHRCFYCQGRLTDRVEIDHFVPWSRHPENAVENLVPAHDKCNNAKRDFLAASAHVRPWRDRMVGRRADLADLARDAGFDSAAERVLGIARGIYLRLGPTAPLWIRRDELAPRGDEAFAPLLAPLGAD